MSDSLGPRGLYHARPLSSPLSESAQTHARCDDDSIWPSHPFALNNTDFTRILFKIIFERSWKNQVKVNQGGRHEELIPYFVKIKLK